MTNLYLSHELWVNNFRRYWRYHFMDLFSLRNYHLLQRGGLSVCVGTRVFRIVNTGKKLSSQVVKVYLNHMNSCAYFEQLFSTSIGDFRCNTLNAVKEFLFDGFYTTCKAETISDFLSDCYVKLFSLRILTLILMKTPQALNWSWHLKKNGLEGFFSALSIPNIDMIEHSKLIDMSISVT